jgi:hypothetical protein
MNPCTGSQSSSCDHHTQRDAMLNKVPLDEESTYANGREKRQRICLMALSKTKKKANEESSSAASSIAIAIFLFVVGIR